MTLAPDHLGYYNHREDDPQFVDLVSLHTDATHPVVDPVTQKEAEHAVLYFIQQWHSGDIEDLGLAYCCLAADLGHRPNEAGFIELANEYREPFTPDEADTFTQNLTTYTRDNRKA